jgi:hypothetical protein
VEVIATTTAAIVGNVTGVLSTTANVAGVVMTGSGTLTITGNIVGMGGNRASACVYSNTACVVTVLGNVNGGGGGGSNYGIRFDAAAGPATVNVTGDATGGISGPGANDNPAISTFAATATVNVTGNVVGGTAGINGHGVRAVNVFVIGDITGVAREGVLATNATTTGSITGSATSAGAAGVQISGTGTCIGTFNGGTGGAPGINALATSIVDATGDAYGVGASANGIRSVSTTGGVTLNGNMIPSSQGAMGVSAYNLRLEDNATQVLQFISSTNTTITRVSPDNVTGMPAETDVRGALVYGFNSELTGSLAVPPAASVGIGVPVDNTVGTAALAPADIAALVGAQIAAAVDSLP